MNVQIPCRFVETKRKYENHFTIAIFKTSKKNIPEEFLDKNERRRKITVSVKGYDIPTPKEYDVLINGDFKVEPVYGYTIVVNSAQIIQPTDVEGIQQYLIDFVDGIGPKVAQKMTDTFGDETLKVLENNPERLSEVPRLRKSSIDKILVSYEKTKLLFLGDTVQLPSVGAGNVLHELVRSCKVPYTKLDVIYRQSFDNVIIKNASNIRYGIRSVITNDNFKIIEKPSPQQAVETITRLYL